MTEYFGHQLICGILYRAVEDWARACDGKPTREQRLVTETMRFRDPLEELRSFFTSERCETFCLVVNMSHDAYLNRIAEIQEEANARNETV